MTKTEKARALQAIQDYNEECLFVRRYDKEEYSFFIKYSVFDGIEKFYPVCQTPENCFGYPDTVLLSKHVVYDRNGYYCGEEPYAYPLQRRLQPWILKSIEKVLIEMQEFINEHSIKEAV